MFRVGLVINFAPTLLVFGSEKTETGLSATPTPLFPDYGYILEPAIQELFRVPVGILRARGLPFPFLSTINSPRT